jgi:hypothetical protein
MAFASALSLVVHIPEKYTNVETGERFYFEIEIMYPENPLRQDLRLTYQIQKEGEAIAQSKVLKAVETQASFIDFIIIPENAESGLYVINVKIEDYQNLVEEVSASFHIIDGKSNQIRMYFFVLLGVTLFVGFLIMFEIYRLKK